MPGPLECKRTISSPRPSSAAGSTNVLFGDRNELPSFSDIAEGSTPGDSFIRGRNKEPALQVQYEFPAAATYYVACKVQDDMGDDGLRSGEIVVE